MSFSNLKMPNLQNETAEKTKKNICHIVKYENSTFQDAINAIHIWNFFFSCYNVTINDEDKNTIINIIKITLDTIKRYIPDTKSKNIIINHPINDITEGHIGKNIYFSEKIVCINELFTIINFSIKDKTIRWHFLESIKNELKFSEIKPSTVEKYVKNILFKNNYSSKIFKDVKNFYYFNKKDCDLIICNDWPSYSIIANKNRFKNKPNTNDSNDIKTIIETETFKELFFSNTPIGSISNLIKTINENMNNDSFDQSEITFVQKQIIDPFINNIIISFNKCHKINPEYCEDLMNDTTLVPFDMTIYPLVNNMNNIINKIKSIIDKIDDLEIMGIFTENIDKYIQMNHDNTMYVLSNEIYVCIYADTFSMDDFYSCRSVILRKKLANIDYDMNFQFNYQLKYTTILDIAIMIFAEFYRMEKYYYSSNNSRFDELYQVITEMKKIVYPTLHVIFNVLNNLYEEEYELYKLIADTSFSNGDSDEFEISHDYKNHNIEGSSFGAFRISSNKKIKCNGFHMFHYIVFLIKRVYHTNTLYGDRSNTIQHLSMIYDMFEKYIDEDTHFTKLRITVCDDLRKLADQFRNICIGSNEQVYSKFDCKKYREDRKNRNTLQ